MNMEVLVDVINTMMAIAALMYFSAGIGLCIYAFLKKIRNPEKFKELDIMDYVVGYAALIIIWPLVIFMK